MKKTIVLGALALVIFSCKDGTEDLQRIDQVGHIYIDSLGQDMLNSVIPGSYYLVTMNDVNGDTDLSPVSFSISKDADTVSYINYVSGAKRLDVPGTNFYESKIALALTKKINDSVSKTSNDTMVIRYENTPEIFQINSVVYNGTTVFTKTPGLPNTIKVVK